MQMIRCFSSSSVIHPDMRSTYNLHKDQKTGTLQKCKCISMCAQGSYAPWQVRSMRISPGVSVNLYEHCTGPFETTISDQNGSPRRAGPFQPLSKSLDGGRYMCLRCRLCLLYSSSKQGCRPWWLLWEASKWCVTGWVWVDVRVHMFVCMYMCVTPVCVCVHVRSDVRPRMH